MTRLLNAFGEVAAWLLITPADKAVGAWLWLRGLPARVDEKWAGALGGEEE